MSASAKILAFRKRRGFTLIEVLIVVAIIAILASLAIFLLINNLAKSRDGKRKADLDRVKIAFEEYYGDKNNYPQTDILASCGSSDLKPYLSTIPCDPKTKRPYCYVYDTDNNGQNYRLLSSLEIKDDPIISQLGCSDGEEYCGYESECITYGSKFNYGVSSTNVVVASENIGSGEIGVSPSPSPSLGPLPSTTPGSYACSPQGVCNNYVDPQAAGCPLTWNNSGACSDYCPTSPTYARCIQ